MTNSIDAILSQYEKNTQRATSGSQLSNEDRLKKYFTTILPKGTPSGQKRIRILPTTDGTSPFKEVSFHEIQVDGKWMKLYDPSQDGDPSPLNEVQKALLATGSETDKVNARNYRARKFYIVKVIDRDNEQDGPKFWRFKHNYKGEGPLDKIIPIIRSKGNITDVTEGRDLILSLTLTKAPNGREYTTINSIIQEDKSPLHNDSEVSNEWTNHADTWRDVYSVKPVEYLEMVALGEVPRWDSEQKKYVSQSESESDFGGANVTAPVEQSTTTTEDPQQNQETSDELPF
jgi:hypothetical protein